MSVVPVATEMRVAAPRPSIALLAAERGNKPPQSEGIEVLIHRNAEAAWNLNQQRRRLRHRDQDSLFNKMHRKQRHRAGFGSSCRWQRLPNGALTFATAQQAGNAGDWHLALKAKFSRSLSALGRGGK